MQQLIVFIALLLMMLCAASTAVAGPYTTAGIAGYVDADGFHASPPALTGNPDTILNPIFRGWATAVDPNSYLPSDTAWSSTEAGDGWDNYDDVPGPATGLHADVVSLGDLDATEIAAGNAPGQITLTFGDPCDPNNLTNPIHAIRNGMGYDFVVFENAFALEASDDPNNLLWNEAGISADIFAELAYVEVSTDGIHFARFPCVSLTPDPLGFGTIDATDIHNLAGKHPNGYGKCFGTPFDLEDLVNDPCVIAGQIDLNNIRYVRIVDIPGSGDFYDNADQFTDPCNAPSYSNYAQNHPIYDAWLTKGSGGFDLEAIGVLHEQELSADINLNGIVDLQDFAVLSHKWLSKWGIDQSYYIRADICPTNDYTIDAIDLAVFADQWLQQEAWRITN